MIKVPKDMIIEKIKQKSGLSDKEISSKIKDKLDQLSGLISEEGALHIIANELGVKILEDNAKLQIKNVLAGMRSVEITAKVVKIYEIRHFERENRKGKVGNFLIGDETGVMRVVAWNEKADLLEKLSENSMIRIKNGYARENNGRVEVHLGDRTEIELDPKDAEKIDVQSRRDQKKISELNENDQNVEIMGTIVQVFDPKFFPIDPESGRKAQEKDGAYYYENKKIDNIDYSYVTNLFLDDGTENIRVVLWRNQTDRLFNMSHEDIVSKKDDPFEDIKNDLLGQIVKLVGRTNRNEMFDRLEFIPNLVIMDPNPVEEKEKVDEKIAETKSEQNKKEEQLEENVESVNIDESSEQEESVVDDEESSSEDLDIDDIDDLTDLDDL